MTHYWVCRIRSFVALWDLSHYEVCRIIKFVAVWYLSHYEDCHIMRFFALWSLSYYEVCRQLWGLSHYEVCRLLGLSKYPSCTLYCTVVVKSCFVGLLEATRKFTYIVSSWTIFPNYYFSVIPRAVVNHNSHLSHEFIWILLGVLLMSVMNLFLL